LNPFHARGAEERQPPLDGDLGDLARMSLCGEFVGQASADDAELFGDDRLNGADGTSPT